jgi:hypothetical protein
MALAMVIVNDLGLEVWHFFVPLAPNLMSIYLKNGTKTLYSGSIHLCTLHS